MIVGVTSPTIRMIPWNSRRRILILTHLVNEGAQVEIHRERRRSRLTICMCVCCTTGMGLLSRCTTKMGMLKCYSLLDIPEICSVCLDLLLDSSKGFLKSVGGSLGSSQRVG